MTYAELYPSLVFKNLIQPRNPPHTPESLPWWFKPNLHCDFHQGALGHDIKNCYPLKYEIHKLIKRGMVSFEDQAPNVKANLFLAHGNASMNMVLKTPEWVVIQFDNSSSKNVNRSVSPLVIWLAGPVPYSSDKVVMYKYNDTMTENGQEVPLLAGNSIVSIADVVKVTCGGRVFGPVSPRVVEDVTIGNKVDVPVVDPINAPTCQSGESSGLKINVDDEVLRLIKKSKFNVVEQLLQTPSKIYVLSLLMNFEAHKEALKKVFSGEELPEKGRNHNLALHISMNCKEDTMSNVLVDTGSSLNVFPKSTLARLSYQGAPMGYSGVVVKAFDGSRKTVIEEKLKFVKNGKLVIVDGEKALLVSHLSSFTYVEAEE
ncbi:uncharacterized protein LOC127094184 [Lathyrus oleraceus]|uniref:uncharacterized protein LOC127094184 n=1 Tax=Pisum sativum TaxID=3888 RepID=UPI0021D3316B|nr:uncharacterized protein LOC127094184 [Pisum sativum]